VIGLFVEAALVDVTGDTGLSLAFFGVPPLVAGLTAAWASRAASSGWVRTAALVLAAMAIAILIPLVALVVFVQPE
jgi:hypothetical protein